MFLWYEVWAVSIRVALSEDKSSSTLSRSLEVLCVAWSISPHHYHSGNSSVIRQKGEPQNGCFEKKKHAKFSQKRTFLTAWYGHTKRSYILKQTCSFQLLVCAYQGVRNVRFSENLEWFFFLKHPIWDSPFCLITDELTLEP